MERIEVNKTYKLYINGTFPRSESGRTYPLYSKAEKLIANIPLSSRKDVKNAVSAAQKALSGWGNKSAFNRSQILYRIAEVLEDRKLVFLKELMLQGASENEANTEVELSIDRIVHYAGWADKYQQLLSSVNPVSSSHFNYSSLEPVGVVGIVANSEHGLLGMVSMILPAIVGGNTCVVLSSKNKPLSAVTFGEVLNASDVPAGVVNLLTGDSIELEDVFASHMQIDALCFSNLPIEGVRKIEEKSVVNVKRIVNYNNENWGNESAQGLTQIENIQEIKTVWQPIEKIGANGSSY